MQSLKNQENSELSVQDHAVPSMNDSGTCEQVGTPLTQACSPDVPRKPHVENAPGLVWRFRRKRWVAYWQARSDLVKRGYAPGAVRLWEGKDLNEAGARKIASQCRKHQAVMLTWGRKRSKPTPPVTTAATVRTQRPEYNVWESMLTRCRNPRHHSYPPYGGRGITVCERWLSFDNFYEDMGPRPPGYWIERRDNNGNYEPGNCHWATPKEQQYNTRRSIAKRAREMGSATT
jgi:hypothetical protein